MTDDNDERPIPYSKERLLRLCKTWSFTSDVQEELNERYPDDDDPRSHANSRACRRVMEAMAEWRDHHQPDDDPIFDESLQPFHICDVAILVEECRRLWRLERRMRLALGPPCRESRWNDKIGKFEDWGPAE